MNLIQLKTFCAAARTLSFTAAAEELMVSQRAGTFWSGVREEHPDMIVPMVQSGIGSALVNEQHILGIEPEVLLLPLDFLEPAEVHVFYPAGRESEPVMDLLDRLKEA